MRLLHEKMVELGGEHGPVRLRDLRGLTGLIRVDEDEALGEAEYLRQIALSDEIPSDVGPEDERAAIWRGGRPLYFVRRVKRGRRVLPRKPPTGNGSSGATNSQHRCNPRSTRLT